MIYNNNTPSLWSDGRGEGRAITPPILMWRSVIVRAMMDALDVDIHAWGKHRTKIVQDANAWFNTNDTHFCEVYEHSNFEPSHQPSTLQRENKIHGEANMLKTH